MNIQNNSDYILTPEQQQAIRNATANYGYDEAVATEIEKDFYGPMTARIESVDGVFLYYINLKTLEITEFYPGSRIPGRRFQK
jgi:hypothetical protein